MRQFPKSHDVVVAQYLPVPGRGAPNVGGRPMSSAVLVGL